MSHDIEMDDIVQTDTNQLSETRRLMEDNSPIVTLEQFKNYLLTNNISNDYLDSSADFNRDFIVNLPEGKFKITKIYRILPNRRVVVQAYNMVLGILVVIKIFIHDSKYKKDYNLLLKNHGLLTVNKLLTPKILANTLDFTNELSYVIFEYIEPDQKPVEPINNNKLFIAAIAKLHKKYIYQQDLHLNNFIVSNKKVYCVDIEGMFAKTGYLVNQNALDNFSMFLAQLDMTYCNQWYDYINYYLQCLIPNITSTKKILKTIKYIHKKAHELLDQRLDKFLVKAQRENTQFKIIDSSFSVASSSAKTSKKYKIDGVVKRQYYKWLDLFIKNPQQFIADHQVNILKQGNTAYVYLIEYKGHRFVIKEYLKKNFIHQIVASIKAKFKWPRALNSWLYANLLEHVNISTPSPLGYFLTKRFGLIQTSYFIMNFDESFVSLANVDIQGSGVHSYQDIAMKIQDLLFKLDFLNLAHQDFKSNNLALLEHTAEQLTVFDIDAMRRYKNKLFFKSQHKKDIDRILRSYDNNGDFLKLLKARLNDEYEEF